MKQKLYLIRGIPGSGKTTYARRLMNDGLVDVHHETDQEFVNSAGVYQFDQSRLSEAHSNTQNKTKESLQQGKSVVVSNTFTKLWELMPYIEMACELNVDVVVIHVIGYFPNTHNVPDDVVERMLKNYEPYEFERIYKNEFIRKEF